MAAFFDLETTGLSPTKDESGAFVFSAGAAPLDCRLACNPFPQEDNKIVKITVIATKFVPLVFMIFSFTFKIFWSRSLFSQQIFQDYPAVELSQDCQAVAHPGRRARELLDELSKPTHIDTRWWPGCQGRPVHHPGVVVAVGAHSPG